MTTPTRDLIAWSLAALALAPGLPASTSITPGAPATQGVLDAADIEPIPASDDRSGAAFFREGFTFSVSRPGMVQIDLQSAFDAYLILYGPGDVEVARNDDFQSTSQSRISTMLTQTGTHRVIVTSFSAGQGGQFTLAVSEIQSDAEPSRDQTIRLGQTIQGTLEMGDAAVLPEQRGTPDYFRDGFVFRARSGQSVTIDLRVRRGRRRLLITERRARNREHRKSNPEGGSFEPHPGSVVRTIRFVTLPSACVLPLLGVLGLLGRDHTKQLQGQIGKAVARHGAHQVKLELRLLKALLERRVRLAHLGQVGL